MSAAQAGRRAAGFVSLKNISSRAWVPLSNSAVQAKTDIRLAPPVPFRVPLPAV
jgi:hypothetical protein